MDIAVVVILVAACGALAGGLGYWAVRIGRNR
ncbi:MAG TPA: small membrane protein MtfM [Stackebrandtia sp.]|nr:small membrane protein MtfM [Stackebrandtia sp.]HZE41132.1 small membrane protein MtfM [Stackebrandtia sp.]